jgi:predicted RNA binding protein YcfA (HicA-like mRNA interferase family)
MGNSNTAKVATREVLRVAKKWGFTEAGATGGHSYMLAPDGSTKVAYRPSGHDHSGKEMQEGTIANFAKAVGVTRAEFLAGPPDKPKKKAPGIDEKCAKCKSRFAEDADTHLCLPCLEAVTTPQPVETRVYRTRRELALLAFAELAWDKWVPVSDIASKVSVWFTGEDREAWDAYFRNPATGGFRMQQSARKEIAVVAAREHGWKVEFKSPNGGRGRAGQVHVKVTSLTAPQPTGTVLCPSELGARARDFYQRSRKAAATMTGRKAAPPPPYDAPIVVDEPEPERVVAVEAPVEQTGDVQTAAGVVWMQAALWERVEREAARRTLHPQRLCNLVVEHWLDEHEGKPLL